ncbi:hypothetical protein BG005_002277 [Podila minutissima]|nr:hypothetical protein BG005_002277 [Podila minutissima]
MNQPIFEGALPILSNILGNNTVAGLLAVFNLALNTITSATESVHDADHNNHFRRSQTYFSSSSTTNHNQNTQDSSTFQSQVFSYFVTAFASLNAMFASITDSDTPLTTYIAVALLSYLVFRIVYGFICWIVRSVINLIKVSIMITALTTLLWFIFTVTTVGDDDVIGGGEGATYANTNKRQKDPISSFVTNIQSKFKSEYQRQQQHVQNAHVY